MGWSKYLTEIKITGSYWPEETQRALLQWQGFRKMRGQMKISLKSLLSVDTLVTKAARKSKFLSYNGLRFFTWGSVFFAGALR